VREGVRTQKSPVVPICRRNSLHHGEKRRRETGDPSATAAERKQALRHPDHQYISWVIGQVLTDEGIRAGALAIDEQGDRLNLLLLSARQPWSQRLRLLRPFPGLGDLSAQMPHIRQSAMRQGKLWIGLNSLGELFIRAEILFQKQIETFDEALGRHG